MKYAQRQTCRHKWGMVEDLHGPTLEASQDIVKKNQKNVRRLDWQHAESHPFPMLQLRWRFPEYQVFSFGEPYIVFNNCGSSIGAESTVKACVSSCVFFLSHALNILEAGFTAGNMLACLCRSDNPQSFCRMFSSSMISIAFSNVVHNLSQFMTVFNERSQISSGLIWTHLGWMEHEPLRCKKKSMERVCIEKFSDGRVIISPFLSLK